jgi:hypothetical protein
MSSTVRPAVSRVPQVDTVEQDAALVGVVEVGDQAGQG